MRAVEESNLSFVVWSLARYEEDVESRLVRREFCSYRFRSFDNPEMEDFTLYHEVVLEAYALMNLIDSIFRISGNDTVNKSAVYSTSLLKPGLEVFSEKSCITAPMMNAYASICSAKFSRGKRCISSW